jgi:hypothetical protein
LELFVRIKKNSDSDFDWNLLRCHDFQCKRMNFNSEFKALQVKQSKITAVSLHIQNKSNFPELQIKVTVTFNYSQTFVQKTPCGPQKVAVVQMWSQFTGHSKKISI